MGADGSAGPNFSERDHIGVADNVSGRFPSAVENILGEK
jgi:hypothetical protein